MAATLPASRPLSIAIPIAVLVMTATAIWVCLSGVPLIWDGAYQLAETLILQRPYVYLTRFHTYFLWQPTVWASHHTDNLKVLTFLYGFPFIIAPALGLALSWWIVRKHAPHLILWAVFGTAAAALPGQIFVINDSYFQQHLFWPVFLAAFVPLTPVKRAVVVLLCVAQLVHPIGMALTAGAAATALILAWFEPERRAHLFMFAGLMALVGIAAAMKLHFAPDSYANEEFVVWKAVERWHNGVAGFPIRGLMIMTAACAVALVQPLWRSRQGTAGDLSVEGNADAMFRNLALVLAAFAGFVWIYWCSDPGRWSGAIDYRRWLVPLTVPFFLATLIDALGVRVDPDAVRHINWRLRGQLSIVVVVIFASVLSIQSYQWLRATERLHDEMTTLPGPIVAWDDLQCLPNSPLGHWGISSYVFLAQGKTPTKILAPQTHGTNAPLIEPFFQIPPMIPLTPDGVIYPEPSSGGWFDSRVLVQEVLKTYRPSTRATDASSKTSR